MPSYTAARIKSGQAGVWLGVKGRSPTPAQRRQRSLNRWREIYRDIKTCFEAMPLPAPAFEALDPVARADRQERATIAESDAKFRAALRNEVRAP